VNEALQKPVEFFKLEYPHSLCLAVKESMRNKFLQLYLYGARG
jgi:hypothetical protein